MPYFARFNYSSLRLIFLKCITLKVFNYPKQVIPVWITFHLKTPTWEKLPEMICWPAWAFFHSFHYIRVSLVYRYKMDNSFMFIDITRGYTRGYAAFTCCRNYRKYQLLSQKLDIDAIRETLYGQFPTRKLVFTIIPTARECSINLYK